MKIRKLKRFNDEFFITDNNGVFISGPRFKTHDEAKRYLSRTKRGCKAKVIK